MRRALLLAAVVVVVGGCSGDPGDGVSTTGGEPSIVTTVAPDTTAPVLVTDPPVSTAATSVAPETEPPTTTEAGTAIGDLELTLEPFGAGFTQPVLVVQPAGAERRFVVDQDGVVWAVDGDEPAVLLDIRDRVSFQGEQGLLGLAFPPDHADTGLFYVNYTAGSGETRVSEFTAGDGGGPADPAGERVVLEIPQPAGNHNGGMIDFGPDGYLWIGMGDGGGSDDQFGNGQDESTLLGAMLRIDPAADGDAAYTVPDDNPGFAAPEIWAIGLRNPWRWSFDGDDLWIADVGQGAQEEINRVTTADLGANFGWPLFEGDECYLSDCDEEGLTFPVHAYSHGDGCSITGGYVYRGDAIPALDGHYFFGDYCGGWVRSIDPDGAVTEWLPPGSVSGLSSFGVDAAGDLYVTSTDGPVYRLVESG